jgi:hypothetical protein
VNDKVYIHELIDIIGSNRSRYMHHMAANWSPMAQEDRRQLLYGMWGTVGSTGRWPQVINIWEEPGFDGLARSFRGELSHKDLQDPKLAKWWAEAASMRSGGFDRILVPAPWMPTVSEAMTPDKAQAYAHETVCVPARRAASHLDWVHSDVSKFRGDFGWELLGAWRTAMRHDDECIFVWAIPTFEQWAAFESAGGTDPVDPSAEVISISRFLMVDAPLSPFRIGRQPQRSDRTEEWIE